MEIKKSPNADLENKKLFFVLIGLVFVLAIVYITLEWTKTEVVKYEETVDLSMAEQEELAPVTIQEQKVIPPPPPPEPVVNQVINIVENTAEETGSFESSEAKQDEKIAPPPPPPPPSRVVDDPDEQQIFQIVEKMPSFPGGDKEMMKYIAKTIKYPAVDQENGIQGRVIVSFVVNKDGNIVDAKIVRGVSPSLDKEALRVVNSMPKWNPGEQRGKAVRVSYILPIVFKLQ